MTSEDGFKLYAEGLLKCVSADCLPLTADGYLCYTASVYLTLKNMKNTPKMKVLFLVLIGALGLMACSKEAPSLEERARALDPNTRLSYEGKIEPAAVSVYSQGTHRIVTENGAHLIQSAIINLNQYLDKEVEVSGTLAKTLTKSEPILNVEEIHLTQISFQAPVVEYVSKRYGFKLEHPQTWEAQETNLGFLLLFEGEPWITINVYEKEDRLETFVPTQEDEQGVEVTVAHERALRFKDSDSLRLYVQHPPTRRIYRIHFEEEPFSDPKKQALFYALLESLKFLSVPPLEGPTCGGVENLECGEDFRCELPSGYTDAEGICVPLSGELSQRTCPYISPPTGCAEYRVEEYNKNGCPLRYECLEESLSVFESIESESFPDPSDTPKEVQTPEEDQPTPQEETLDPSSEKESYVIPSVESVKIPHENTWLGFNMKFPTIWHYRYFGPIEGTQGLLGFAPQALEAPEEALVTLKVLKEASTSSSALQKPRPEGGYYVMEGPADLKAVMQAMLDSVEEGTKN